jgi:hypothetical protein
LEALNAVNKQNELEVQEQLAKIKVFKQKSKDEREVFTTKWKEYIAAKEKKSREDLAAYEKKSKEDIAEFRRTHGLNDSE